METVDLRLQNWLAHLPRAQVWALVRLFQEHLPAQIDTLHGALTAADASQLAADAHKLRGAAVQIGTRRMVELCAELETAGQQGSLEGAATRIEALEAEFRTLDRFLVVKLREAEKEGGP